MGLASVGLVSAVAVGLIACCEGDVQIWNIYLPFGQTTYV